MKTILLDAHPDPLIGSRVSAARALARTFRAKVIALQTLPRHRLPVTGALTPEWPMKAIEAAEAADVAAADRAREAVDNRFGASRALRWDRMTGRRGEQLLLRSRLADLTIVSIEDLREFGGLPENAAKRAGSPLLAIPSDTVDLSSEAPILIAWDGSAAVASAMKAALPLLRRSRDVRLVTIGADPIVPLEGAIDYLASYGVSASADVVSHRLCVAMAIIEVADSYCAGLIVIGATGHGPVRHALLGSVADALLARDRYPLFIGH
jgi:nucleotide-binding universal stress UspA family protein